MGIIQVSNDGALDQDGNGGDVIIFWWVDFEYYLNIKRPNFLIV